MLVVKTKLSFLEVQVEGVRRKPFILLLTNLSITPPFSIVKMFNQNINDLLSFSVFFLVNEFVGLEFD